MKEKKKKLGKKGEDKEESIPEPAHPLSTGIDAGIPPFPSLPPRGHVTHWSA